RHQIQPALPLDETLQIDAVGDQRDLLRRHAHGGFQRLAGETTDRDDGVRLGQRAATAAATDVVRHAAADFFPVHVDDAAQPEQAARDRRQPAAGHQLADADHADILGPGDAAYGTQQTDADGDIAQRRDD